MRLCLIACLASLALAGPQKLELQRTLDGAACWPWERVECWRNLDPHFSQESFRPSTAHLPESIFGVGIPEAFGGTREPHSGLFLLHFAKGWESPRQPVPVLLVHGCQSDATRSFASVWFDGRKGLMQFLCERGFAVFALTFPCGQGDLYFQAQHVIAALRLIRERTGAEQVDVVAHSAGGIAARMALTSVRQPWGAPYQKDVRRMVFAATPHRGLDFIFRHPIAFIRFAAYGMPAPWEWYAPLGDVAAQSVYDPAFRMQQQLLGDLSGLVPLNEKEVDWYTTWHGGNGYVSRSRGLAAAMKLGGDHMATVRSARFPKKTEVFILAGEHNELQYLELGTGKLLIEAGEYDGPSDGICFVASATDPDGFALAKADVRETLILPLNHVALLFAQEAQNFVATALNGGPLDDDACIPLDWNRPETLDRQPAPDGGTGPLQPDQTVVGPRD